MDQQDNSSPRRAAGNAAPLGDESVRNDHGLWSVAQTIDYAPLTSVVTKEDVDGIPRSPRR